MFEKIKSCCPAILGSYGDAFGRHFQGRSKAMNEQAAAIKVILLVIIRS
ncbi:hypothetical protein [Paenibacillus albidus]|nr:hypothetical protein [Paenibacillus albidus]